MDVIWIVIGAILLAATALLALLFFHESPTVTILLIWKANDVPSSDLKDLFSLVSGPQVAARRIHLDRRPLLEPDRRHTCRLARHGIQGRKFCVSLLSQTASCEDRHYRNLLPSEPPESRND